MDFLKGDKKKKQSKEYNEKEFTPCDIKLIILGDSAVGKSKIVERFLLDDYEERQLSTFALTMYRHNAKIEGKDYKDILNQTYFSFGEQVDIWDTAGQECFQTLHPSYYFGANVCILVFDITRKITYQNLKTWYNEMREHCPSIPCILIANKIDLDKKVTEKTFKFASQYNLPFYFVSAADGTNVVKIFSEALRLGLDNKLNPPDSFYSEVMDLLNDVKIYQFRYINIYGFYNRKHYLIMNKLVNKVSFIKKNYPRICFFKSYKSKLNKLRNAYINI